jgi:TRAP-type C4-dicarboxylate transport system permease small subunit
LRLTGVDRFIDAIIDWTERAAGLFLAAIVALTFVSVTLRATLNTTIPDWFDLSRLFLGIAIFWGIASTSYRHEHIQVDFVWEWLGPRGRRLVDLFATGVLLAFLAAFAWMLTYKVGSGFSSGEATFDRRTPIWPFHLVAALGIVLATVLVAVRLVRIVRGTYVGAPRPIDPVQ